MDGIMRGAGLAVPAILFAGVAQAHTGAGATGSLAAGLAHPLLGPDHILAMTAVGLWAALLGGRALWLLPSTFVIGMVIGGIMGMGALTLPTAETVIVGSVVILGGLIAVRPTVPVYMAVGTAAVFAVFHGYAHGAEAPSDASGLIYALGFAISTTFLHAVGIGWVLLANRLATGQAVRAVGGGIALAGIALFAFG